MTLAVLLSAAAQGATTITTLTVTGTIKLNATFDGFDVAGTTNMTPAIGAGTIAASIPLSAVYKDPATTTFTITVTSGGTLTGDLSIPQSVIVGSGGSGSMSLTVKDGTGAYKGANGVFTIAGTLSGSMTSGFTFTNLTGIASLGTGGSTASPSPAITAVWDSASNTANVAQGSIFIVKGTNLCPSGTNFFNVPRPTTAPDGVKITFTPAKGGAGTDSILIYEYNPAGACQLAAILPSTVTEGDYNVTVTNGLPSAVFATKVVQRKPALFTQDSSGGGMASVQNYVSSSRVDLNSFTSGTGKGATISPAKPGQFLIAYGTGLGPLAATTQPHRRTISMPMASP